jgi:DNA-binding NarL/FixJ family response regulator
MMDRSRIAGAVPGTEFIDAVDDCADADIVIVDLARRGADVASVRAGTPAARIVAYGPHVDDAAFERALREGADVALPRSRFFRDVEAALA